MYEYYWDLEEKPFKNTMSPKFFYFSPEHEETLVRMLLTVTDAKGLMFLTGESGVGKTYISRMFASEMHEKGFAVAMLVNPMFSPEQLLQEILYEFGVHESYNNKADLWQRLSQHLHGLAESGGHAVLIIDEAQLIQNRETLEEIRLLLNLESDDRPLLDIFMIGEPDLWSRTRTMPQLLQRIGVAYHLNPLPEAETAKYIAHRLSVAGAKREIFNAEACALIHAHARGVLREINNICDLALLIASGMELKEVGRDTIIECIKEMHGGLEEHGVLDQIIARGGAPAS